MRRRIGMLIFPGMTQLDMTGPYEVLARTPNSVVDLVARALEPVTSDRGMQILPTVTYETCPPLDLIMRLQARGAKLYEERKAVAARVGTKLGV